MEGINAPFFRVHNCFAAPLNIKMTSCTFCSAFTFIIPNNFLISLIQSSATSRLKPPLKVGVLSLLNFSILLVSTPSCPVVCVWNCDDSRYNSLSLIIIANLFITLHNLLKSSWLAPDEFGGGTYRARSGTCDARGCYLMDKGWYRMKKRWSLMLYLDYR